MIKEKYHTVGTVLKSNRTKYLKNVISIPNMLTIKHYYYLDRKRKDLFM